MAIETRFGVLLLFALLQFPSLTSTQQNIPADGSTGKIYLDVVVTPKSGVPVAGLQQ